MWHRTHTVCFKPWNRAHFSVNIHLSDDGVWQIILNIIFEHCPFFAFFFQTQHFGIRTCNRHHTVHTQAVPWERGRRGRTMSKTTPIFTGHSQYTHTTVRRPVHLRAEPIFTVHSQHSQTASPSQGWAYLHSHHSQTASPSQGWAHLHSTLTPQSDCQSISGLSPSSQDTHTTVRLPVHLRAEPNFTVHSHHSQTASPSQAWAHLHSTLTPQSDCQSISGLSPRGAHNQILVMTISVTTSLSALCDERVGSVLC
jgi:hypothetical protein